MANEYTSASLKVQDPRVETTVPDVSGYPSVPAWHNNLYGNLAGMAVDYGAGYLGNMFGDSEVGRHIGTTLTSGVTAAGKTLVDNIIRGQAVGQGMMQNFGSGLAATGVGIASNYLGKGITSLMGNSKLGRGVGAGVSTAAGTLGGRAVQGLLGKAVGAINPYAFGAQVLGSALGAAMGPSKEYGGKYGNTTRTMDTVYDTATVAVNAIPGAGQLISGMMALNKGLSNVFGSTDGMTKTDAILGSAFMPAPVKWLNMAWSQKTGTFNNQSWQNSQKATDFMQNAFGNLNDRFDKAREESGKVYGSFSGGAYRKAQNNINFANQAWGDIMDLARQNKYQNIRSQAMTSINNQRYAQNIQGGFNTLARGKMGMKILNNSINHNLGQRYLSGAALIDDKQMILSKCREVD